MKIAQRTVATNSRQKRSRDRPLAAGVPPPQAGAARCRARSGGGAHGVSEGAVFEKAQCAMCTNMCVPVGNPSHTHDGWLTCVAHFTGTPSARQLELRESYLTQCHIPHGIYYLHNNGFLGGRLATSGFSRLFQNDLAPTYT